MHSYLVTFSVFFSYFIVSIFDTEKSQSNNNRIIKQPYLNTLHLQYSILGSIYSKYKINP